MKRAIAHSIIHERLLWIKDTLVTFIRQKCSSTLRFFFVLLYIEQNEYVTHIFFFLFLYVTVSVTLDSSIQSNTRINTFISTLPLSNRCVMPFLLMLCAIFLRVHYHLHFILVTCLSKWDFLYHQYQFYP
jgi:hypothetical protein